MEAKCLQDDAPAKIVAATANLHFDINSIFLGIAS